MSPRMLIVLWVLVAPLARAEVFDVSVPPREGDRFKSADFRLWVPDGAKVIRAVIVHQHGCGRNGINNATDLQWQALAAKHDAALMGTTLVPNDKCVDWHEPGNGSDDAFQAALAKVAERAKRPEIATAPWCLWGHSGGAHWAVAMTARHPERVVAVFARSGGQPGKVPAGVPVCFNLGAKEESDRFAKGFATARGVFETGRADGAVWAWAVDPKASHDTRNSRDLAIPYFDACLALRLPEKAGDKLRAVDVGAGWLGDNKTFDVATAGAFKGGQGAAASWLPSERVAAAWREFVASGQVTDRTPPAAPTGLKLARDGRQVTLTWDATTDPESGAKAYRVYRDNQMIGTVAGQKPNYGDEPEPATVAPKLSDEPPVTFAPPQYRVTAVNRFDLESEKSEPVGRAEAK